MLLLEHTCTIKRNVAVGTNGRYQMQDLATNVACLRLPMNVQTAIQNEFSLGRAYDIYFADTQDVKPGDKIIISGDSHIVKAVQPYQLPLVGHVRALCEQEVS
jgi:hypothetical protein